MAAKEGGGNSREEGEEEGGEEMQGMSARERKLHLLRQKMKSSREDNQKAVADERKKGAAEAEKRRGGDDGAQRNGAKKKYYEDMKGREKAQLKALGLDEDKGYLIQTEEFAKKQYKKQEKKPAAFGWDAFNQETLYTAYQKRADAIPVDLKAYERAKAEEPEFYREGNSMLYGQAPKLPKENIDKMVAELDEQQARKDKFSRRRKHYDGRDADSINDRNAHYNRKIDRAFSNYTKEIKLNLERGTALPDQL